MQQLDVKKAFDEAADLSGDVVDIDNSETTERVFTELATLNPIQYDLVREAKAKELGIRVGTLDAERKKRQSKEHDGAGHEIELWPT